MMNPSKWIAGLGAGALLISAGLAQAHPPRAADLDADRDGRVTRAEVEAFAARHVQQLDADADGVISEADLRAMEERRRERRMHRRLKAADANGDGVVSVDEFRDRMVERMMKRDANDDGEIGPDERPRPDPRGPRPDAP